MCYPELNISEELDGTNFVTTKMINDGREKIYSGFKVDELQAASDHLLSIFADKTKYSREIDCLEKFKEITHCFRYIKDCSCVRDDYWIRKDNN